jgi:AcrR family transcriptional regulator
MARPRSDDKQEAILEAAIRVIASQGLGAPTATIAKQAGVANGSLFTYFETKADLWNALYIALKSEMAAAALDGLSPSADPKAALRHLWSGWLAWATQRPDRRRALALLGTSDEITDLSRRAGNAVMAPIAELIARCGAEGPMRSVDTGFVAALMNATAEATIDFVLSDPKNASRYSRDGFNALWRIIA